MGTGIWDYNPNRMMVEAWYIAGLTVDLLAKLTTDPLLAIANGDFSISNTTTEGKIIELDKSRTITVDITS